MTLSCTVFEILSLIFQKLKGSRDSDHAYFRDGLSSVGWDLLCSTHIPNLKHLGIVWGGSTNSIAGRRKRRGTEADTKTERKRDRRRDRCDAVLRRRRWRMKRVSRRWAAAGTDAGVAGDEWMTAVHCCGSWVVITDVTGRRWRHRKRRRLLYCTPHACSTRHVLHIWFTSYTAVRFEMIHIWCVLLVMWLPL